MSIKDNRCRSGLRSGLLRRTVLVLAALASIGLLMPGDVAAQAKVGTTGAQFLELGVSARSMGMAEAFAAVVDDISAVYYNPAALTSLMGREAMVTYIQMPADVQYGFLAFGMPLESVGGVLGVAAYGLTSGDMIERTYGQGTFDGTGRTFSYNDLAVGVSYGRYLTDRFSIGVTLRYIGSFTHDYSASGWSADVGTDYDTGYRNFRIAMAITNFGPDMTFIEREYPLPINFRFGGSMDAIQTVDHVLTVAAEGSHPSDNLEKYNAGAEYTFKDRYVLRVGGRFNYDSDGFTAGGGLKLPFGDDGEMRIDYAFQDFGLLTSVHRFTFAVAF